MTLCFLAKQVSNPFRPQIYLLAIIDSPLSVGRVAILPLISLSSFPLFHPLLTFLHIPSPPLGKLIYSP